VEPQAAVTPHSVSDAVVRFRCMPDLNTAVSGAAIWYSVHLRWSPSTLNSSAVSATRLLPGLQAAAETIVETIAAVTTAHLCHPGALQSR